MHGGFGTRLRELRRRAGLTIEALAGSSGVSVRAISDAERGRSRLPRPSTVSALATALRLAADDVDRLTALARAGRGTVAAGRPRAGELPRRTVAFIGRQAALATIGEWVTSSPPGGPAVVVVLHGPPGVGKTALARRVAEQHRRRFAGGVLHLDLRGAEPGAVTAGDAASALLRALGVSARRQAADPDTRAGQLRTLLGRRRCLLVLDDVDGEGQVRALLPDTGCVLIAGRRALGGLEAVHRYRVAPLNPAESAQLLHAATGETGTPTGTGVPPATGTPAAIEAVARLCGHLPLALHIAAARLTAGPWARLAERLCDEDGRLAALPGMEAAIAVSHARLAPPVRTVFRRLAHLPAGPFDAVAVSAVAGCDPITAERHLEDLLDRGLLQPGGADRYRLHELIRLFAAARLRAEEGTPDSA